MATNDTFAGQIKDGDDWFLGFASRLDPGNLPDKMLQASSNLRLQRGTATPRLGAKRLTQAVNLVSVFESEYRAVGTYVRQSDGYEFLVAVCSRSMILFYQDGTPFAQYLFVGSGGSPPDPNAYPFIPLGANVQILQALDRLYIFRGAATSSPVSVTFHNSAIAQNTWGTFIVENFPLVGQFSGIAFTRNSTTVTITLPFGHGLTAGQSITIAGSTATIFNGQTVQLLTAGSTSATFANLNTTSSSGTMSVIRSDQVFNREFIIQSTTVPHFNGTYQIQYPENTMPLGILEFSFFNFTPNNISQHTTGTTGMTVLEARSPLYWEYQVTNGVYPIQQISTSGSNANMPPADFGIYYQNRIVCKISPHEIAVSDILSDTFDLTLNNFNINVGSGDSVVGLLPWIENQILVFMKRAIYIAYIEPTVYTTGTPPGANSSITVVTNEVGCLSRRSIVNAGQYVFFLSGKGVHMLTPQLDLKLLGNTIPLSEPIADFFDNFNYTVAYKACAAYYANRFYISVPWNGSTQNNRVLVYNTLNQQWESTDVYPSEMNIDEFFIQSYGNQRRLFAGCAIWSGQESGIVLMDENVGNDLYTLAASGPPTNRPVVPQYISAAMTTREYMFDSLSEKRFVRAQVQTSNVASERIQITANTYDPDAQEMILDYTFQGGTHTTLRPRVALRGSAIALDVQIVSGTPSIKTIQVTAVNTDRPMISQE